MAAILDYFDNISIDVAKRKYYNINKVNAVLEELRSQAVELVEEIERQRMELDGLRTKLSQIQIDGQQTQGMFEKMQNLYRETLAKAHERADGIMREAEADSAQLTQNARARTESAAKLLEESIQAIYAREEQNLRFLDSRLQQLKTVLNGQNPEESEYSEPEPKRVEEPAAETRRPDETPVSEQPDSEEGKGFRASSGQLEALEQKIRKLAEEISALENEI